MKVPGAAIVAVAGLVVWLVASGKLKAKLGTRGRITNMQVDGLPMRSHGVAKTPGATGTITVTWSTSTTDFQGVGVSTWAYRLRFVIQQGNIFSWGFTDPTVFRMGNLESKTATFGYTVPGVAPGGLYSVTAFLEAEGSNDQGVASGPFADIPGVTLTHSNAINVVTTGPVTPQGAIGTVDVAQAILRQMQS